VSEVLTRRLVSASQHETSGVDHPANAPQFGGEGWSVMKATERNGGTMPEAVKKDDATQVAELTQANATLQAQLAAATAASTAAANVTTAIATPVETKPADDEEQAKAQAAEKADLEKALAAVPDVVRKALTDAMEQADKATAAATAATKAHADMIEKAATAECIAKASDLGLADPETFGPVLRAVQVAIAPEAFDRLIQEFTASKARSDEAAKVLLASRGVSKAAPSDGSAEAEIAKRAEAIVAADPKVSAKAALAKAWADAPSDLVERFRAEQA
jgi:hypothetical protein